MIAVLHSLQRLKNVETLLLEKNVQNNYFVVSERVSGRQAADHEREDGQSGCRCRLRGRAVRRLVVAVVLE